MPYVLASLRGRHLDHADLAIGSAPVVIVSPLGFEPPFPPRQAHQLWVLAAGVLPLSTSVARWPGSTPSIRMMSLSELSVRSAAISR